MADGETIEHFSFIVNSELPPTVVGLDGNTRPIEWIGNCTGCTNLCGATCEPVALAVSLVLVGTVLGLDGNTRPIVCGLL